MRRCTHTQVVGVTGFLMQDLGANPLDYVEGGSLNAQRVQISVARCDKSGPVRLRQRGGRMIVTIGTNDTRASPGAQLAYYQSLIDKMGRPAVDRFARLFVIPQADHGLRGTNHGVDGKGTTIPVAPVASNYDRLDVLVDWVENGNAPPRQQKADRRASKAGRGKALHPLLSRL